MATKPRPLKISDLQLLCPIDFDQAFELLIQIGNLLTTLRLESTRRDGNLLDSILNVCTKLKELTVEFSCSDETFYQESFRGPWHPSIGVVSPTPNPSLRSLTLRGIVMDEELLLILVQSCPGLDDLVLDQVTGIAHRELEVKGSHTHVASVFRSIASIRPGLKRFGFLPCVLTKATEHVQARIVPLFSMATEWVFPATSFLSLLELCGWPDDILNRHRWTMMTSLEILVRHKGLNSLSLGLSLHQYLCTVSLSRHLLELKAPDIQVPLDCLDIEGVVSAVGSYRQADHPLWSSTLYDELVPRRNTVWGCRDLRVLHVQIQCSKDDCGSDASSRLVFGYISKACPMLEDLRLQKEHLSLSMGGGLCLLRRLNRLKSLALAARDGIWHTEPELDWMSNELSSRQLDDLKSFINQCVSEEVFNPVYRRFPLNYQAPDVPGTPSWKQDNVVSDHEAGLDMLTVCTGAVPNFIIGGVDVRYLAQLRDVVEELKRRISSGNASCWPNIERLEISRKNARPWGFTSVVDKTEAQMHLMRPDIEFHALWK
ncbi:hypothetical protein BGZ95_005224 [Linnemannia exigua]|uniref:Uncharacterized protein n=1 Tax=Linnemannia exigua TaxID=604196 RepID=A0AAD4DJ38_9FUNG|nr:hypothetical protein BGZ95_005224 [Linnemannia exigua]